MRLDAIPQVARATSVSAQSVQAASGDSYLGDGTQRPSFVPSSGCDS
jgi:hypothetical protein